MPIPRQLPKLCLRGSIANITMANITPQERETINDLTIRIASHPDLQPKRMSIIRGYGTTVGGDYRDDRAAADNEFLIAIWRGVVNLFYHRKYGFKCRACGSAHYLTKRNKIAIIDRQKLACPHCGQVEVVDPGKSDLQTGQYIQYAEFKDIAANFGDDGAPRCKSPIDYIPGDRFYDDPYAIINDRVQLRKFFGEYAWNYCRQQIRENERAEHKKAPQEIIGRADEIILQELLAICRKMKLDFLYEPDISNLDSFDIYLVGLLSPPEFTVELALLRKRALLYDVVIRTVKNSVRVLKNSNALTITGRVSIPEHVMYQEESGDDDENGFTIKQISYRTSGGERMEPDDHVATIDTVDVLEAIRAALPDGTCKAVFDIDSGQGETYRQFSDEFGDNTPKKCQIAEFLGIAHRVVGQCRQQIKANCLYYGLNGLS